MSFRIYNGNKKKETKVITDFDKIWRTYDGSSNNINNPDWGSLNIPLRRKSGFGFEDGISKLAVRGISNPKPRNISNQICINNFDTLNSNNLSNMTWIWGQFVDHEIDLTETNSNEPSNMITSSNDEFPSRIILFNRSKVIFNSSPRENINEISSYLDATNVYGNSSERSLILRELDGTGKLKIQLSENGEILPPNNTFDIENASPENSTKSDFFLCGDIRSNENVFLTSIHTLFVREHNRLCDIIAQEYPNQDEMIFQKARKWVIAFQQQITFNEFLPALLGDNAISEYKGYNHLVDPSIFTEFSTVGYRVGHTMIPSDVLVSPNIFVKLRELFFNPLVVKQNGIDNYLDSATRQVMHEIDGKIVDDLRNFLFGPPTSIHMLDLASLNIQRGRDHGIPGYNDVREAYNLSRHNSFELVSSDISIQNKLSSLYDSVDDIDPWIGGIVEDHIPGSSLGELFTAILKDQFERIRDGDRFWFENDKTFSSQDINNIKNTKLSDIINRNTNITVSDDVFHV